MDTADPVAHQDSWGFWDETWTTFASGYESESDARRALAVYCSVELCSVTHPDIGWYLENPPKWIKGGWE